ncbi:MAG: hypothetical protein WEC79_06910 [Thermomicrobiales bacterium]
MYYRLAALPPTWIEVQLFMLEDRVGRLFLLDPSLERLERLDPADANVLMQWYELSQTVSWHLLPKITRMLSTTCPLRPGRIGARTYEEDSSTVAAAPSVVTGIFEPSNDHRPESQI